MKLISIDQNSHTLWDVLPKLQALAHGGYSVCHSIEDIDVAFTAIGSRVAGDVVGQEMRMARERFYRSGGADWGAAVFYFSFLGRQPVEVRRFEPFTGMKTNVLAGKLSCSVDDLYDRFSPSDNWQLIGPSYFRNRDLHRVIGDLGISRTAGFLLEMIDIARQNMLDAFGGAEAHRRIEGWIDAQRAVLVESIETAGDGTLVELYRRWLGRYVRDPISLGLTSELFACGRDAAQTALLEIFTGRYDEAAELYNAAIAEMQQPQRRLDVGRGELPFFATIDRDGHMVRSGVFLVGGGLQIADMHFDLLSGGRIPVDKLKDAGVIALAGKAMVLVMQARIGPDGRALALPYRGSLYLPASNRLAEKLTAADMMPGELQPIVRVRLGFLDALKTIETPIRLPEYLRGAMDADIVPASRLGSQWRELVTDARERLESFRTDDGRRRWRERTQGVLLEEMDRLDAARRDLAATDPKGPEIRALSKQSRQIDARILDAAVEQIAGDLHTVKLDYWDSRGAVWPWAVALGGDDFYNDLIANARIYTEP
ncbi:MAG: hypothetical protein QGH60_01775 [Phycisphaerae bacterium]|jgi:hypothetical protein|nr:hypothetical protein [Phycisphaerae bacterium]